VTIVLRPGGRRSKLLIQQAYEEEALECPDIDERETPTVLLYPRSYVEAAAALPGEKRYDYSFVGGLYRPETFEPRAWILDFARRHFTDRSYLLVTDGAEHESLGTYDRTNVEQDVFVPKDVPHGERAFFHQRYFEVLRGSAFALCPAGDLPWSMRFFEAVMCRSIPIVSDLEHTGRNELERGIGYRVILPDDDHVFDEEVAEHNYRLFLRHQTLMTTEGTD